MNHKSILVEYWWEKAQESLKSSKILLKENLIRNSVNNLYYSIFYATTSYFLTKGKTFKKHAGVRAEFHKELVKTGKINRKYGKLYDELLTAREEGDYRPFVEFKKSEVETWIKEVEEFLNTMKELIDKEPK